MSSLGSSDAGASRPIFVFGTQRSGTTLLFQVLNGLDDVLLVNEFWDLFDFISGKRTDRGELCQVLAGHLELTDEQGRQIESLDGDALALSHHAFEMRARKRGKSRWGLKDPRLTDFLDPFAERFPEARFIGLLRDPRAVVASHLGRRMNVANVHAGAELWRQQVRRQRDFVERHPDLALWVRFEDLVSDFAGQLKRVCAFLDEPFDESLLLYHQRAPETEVHGGNANIQSPPRPEVAERWKARLSRRQIAVIETLTQPLAGELGYAATVERATITATSRCLYTLHQWAMTTYWWQVRTGWSGLKKRLGLPYDARPNLE